jgi:hypothetical protein
MNEAIEEFSSQIRVFYQNVQELRDQKMQELRERDESGYKVIEQLDQ